MLAHHLKKHKIHYAWILLIACCIFQLALQGVFNYCAGIFYIPVSSSLGISIGEFSVSSTIYGLLLGFFSPVAGKLLSKRWMSVQMAIAAAVMCTVFMMLAFANAIWQWYVAMAIIGACGAFLMIIPIPILINNWFDKYAGIALSVAMAFSSLSGAIISPLGTWIILNWGWRNAYFILGFSAAVLSIPVFLLFVCNSPEQAGMQPYGAKAIQENFLEKASIATENSNMNLDTKALFVFTSASLLCVFKSYYNHISAFTVSIGMSEMDGARLMAFVMIGSIFLRILLGVLNDKLKILHTIDISLLIAMLSLLCLSFFYSNTSLVTIGAFCIGIGPAMMAVLPPLLTSAVYGKEAYAKMFPLVTMASTMASSLGNSLFGFIYDACGSYVPAMLLGVILATITFFVARKTIKS